MNRIKSLTLVFENIESIEIDGRHIGAFEINGIEKQISRIAVNAIIEHESCRRFFMELHPDANKPYFPFGIKDWEEQESVFDRIRKWRDITRIEFDMCTDEVYYGKEEPNETNCKHSEYYVSWRPDADDDDAPGEENIDQKSLISKAGWLYLLVEPDMSLEKLLANADINSEGYAEAEELLCDLGDKRYEMAKARFMEGEEDDGPDCKS